MKIKRFPVTASAKERKEAKEILGSMLGEPGARPFRGHLIYGAKGIRALRLALDLTQKGFARLLLVEVSAVESWEQGRRVPDTSKMAIIHMLHEHPKQMRLWLEQAAEALLPEKVKAAA